MDHGLPPETPSDLVRRALREYEGPLVGYAVSLLSDLELARDAVQDTFLKLYEQEPGKVKAAGLKSWLFTVCRNRCLDLLRRRKRLVSMEEESVGEPVSSERSPAEILETGEEAGQVIQLLKRLPPNQQEVIQLKFQADLSYREISEATGLSISNVGFLIHTGLKRLRQMMSHEIQTRPEPNFAV
ncbi:MAG: sigma-70 family RNA polymerase sigma factor [Verrucomicrobiales bacterium]|nr:sigma-70 family RNA polymerase sigma factor [Verrucomicrobiales bacterium]